MSASIINSNITRRVIGAPYKRDELFFLFLQQPFSYCFDKLGARYCHMLRRLVCYVEVLVRDEQDGITHILVHKMDYEVYEGQYLLGRLSKNLYSIFGYASKLEEFREQLHLYFRVINGDAPRFLWQLECLDVVRLACNAVGAERPCRQLHGYDSASLLEADRAGALHEFGALVNDPPSITRQGGSFGSFRYIGAAKFTFKCGMHLLALLKYIFLGLLPKC
mmetsp:Transcript_19701/g.46235  ORF Transcript_19701/g.46235 Transcript_19701/m.46235 type:complete len:221 (+) Transcript_19701:492-1154(+)